MASLIAVSSYTDTDILAHTPKGNVNARGISCVSRRPHEGGNGFSKAFFGAGGGSPGSGGPRGAEGIVRRAGASGWTTRRAF